MRRVAALGVVGVALFAPAAARAASTITLDVSKHVVRHGGTVRFSGALTPAVDAQRIDLYRVVGSTGTLVGHTRTQADGSFSKRVTLGKGGTFVAHADVDTPDGVFSNQRTVRIRSVIVTHLTGTRSIGHKLVLSGRVRPAKAGVLRRTVNGVTRRVHLGTYGGFHFSLPTGKALPIRTTLRLTPHAGYTSAKRRRVTRLDLPTLSWGARGPAVWALKRQLHAQHYALQRVNGTYGISTVQAVWAFQKVHNLARTGRVGSYVWRLLAKSHVPKARVPRGDHIEISKTHQVIYEVRNGVVVNVLHTSTGATGNTPVGRFHVYSKVPGYNAKEMYYSLFFIGGFAIHGYHSVPPYPASHGCARIPIWAAHALYNRWGYGTTVMVFG